MTDPHDIRLQHTAQFIEDRNRLSYIRQSKRESLCIIMPRKPKDLIWRIDRTYLGQWIRALTALGEIFTIFARTIKSNEPDPTKWTDRILVYDSKVGELTEEYLCQSTA